MKKVKELWQFSVSDRLSTEDDTMPGRVKKDQKEALARRLIEEQKLIMEWLLLLGKSGAETQAVYEEEARHGDFLDRAEASLRKELESATREQLLYSRA